jgi:glycosyl transferase family 87
VIWSDVLPAHPRRLVVAAWGVLALLNLSAGVVIASLSERQSDLESIRGWVQEWLIDGTNLYAARGALTDYPPHAIVALTPLAVLPAEWIVPAWATFNLALALLAPYVALRIARPGWPFRTLLLPLLMFLCWGGSRTLLQFSLLALVSGLLGMALADRRPGWSGAWLGLALMKPHIAAPFLLWAIFTRRLQTVGAALIAVATGTAMFCVVAHTGPLAVLRSYVSILGSLYLLDEDLRMVGLAQLRPLILIAVPDIDLASAAAVALAVALLTVVVILGVREGRRPGEFPISAPPLAAVWSLLTFYHLTYGFLLLLPVATLLIFMNDAATRSLRRAVFWIMQVALMADIPGMWPRIAGVIFPGRPTPFADLASHADRILMAALFVCLIVIWRQAGLKTGPTSGSIRT